MFERFLSLIGSGKDQEPEQSDSKRHGKPSYFKRAALLKGSSNRVISRAKRRSEGAQKRENAEHRANEASLAKSTRTIAAFTKVLALVGALSAVISGGLWYEADSGGRDTHDLAESAKAQAEAMKNQIFALKAQLEESQIEQRPWVYAENISLGDRIEHDVNGIRMTLNFTLSNTGRNPASNVFINADVFPSLPSNNVIGMTSVIKDICHRQFGAIGTAVFPGEKINQGIVTYIPEDRLKEAFRVFQNDFRMIVPTIVACITYLQAGTTVRHGTPIILNVSAVKDGRPCCAIPVSQNELLKTQVVLQRHPVEPVAPY
jgi:hypothetical protein